MKQSKTKPTWGIDPLFTGVQAPRPSSCVARPLAVAWLGAFAMAATACSSKSEKQTYDPVALGMASSDSAFYDDGQTTLYQVTRPISLPILTPTEAQRATLGGPLAPYTHTPWITKNDVKVQISWTVSNLDSASHNVEILLDPWNEFARYLPTLNVSEDNATPDLSGIDILLRVEGLQRKTGTFTFDDMDEVATDLATVQNILVQNAGAGTGPSGLINHAFDIHNRSADNDPLIQRFVPATVAGLVGFDLGLRLYDKGTVAIEIVVEMVDVGGNRVIADSSLRIDGSMWLTPETTVSAPMAMAP